MTEELMATAKQVGLELIDMSDTLADNMQTWGDLLIQNPDSITATLSAGFINKPLMTPGFEMTVDVQALPNEKAVVRTWAIETRIGDDQKEYFNNIQLTFEANEQQVRSLVAKGRDISRKDISDLLQSTTSQLARITVSNQSGGDGTKQTHGERYDFTVTELNNNHDDVTKVGHALREVLQSLKQTLQIISSRKIIVAKYVH